MVLLPEPERPVNHKVAPPCLSKPARSSRMTCPSCQVMLVALISAIPKILHLLGEFRCVVSTLMHQEPRRANAATPARDFFEGLLYEAMREVQPSGASRSGDYANRQ